MDLQRENEALTYDDILMVPQYSEVVPSQISTRSFFAKGIHLNAPVIGAAMDTVTESHMARVLAQLGGLGVIHKNMSPEDQALEVEKVKKYESGVIFNPITLSPEATVDEALRLMDRFSISGVPITTNKKLVGILTHRDLRFETNTSQPVSNIMTKENLVTTSQGTTLEEAKILLQKHRIEKLLVVNDSMELKGLITIKDIEKSTNYPQSSKDSRGCLLVGAAVGTDDISRQRVQALMEKSVDVLVVDTAHGHSKNVLEMVEWVRKEFPDGVLVAGNVVTASGCEALYEKGADVVKVGVGPGSICTTRMVAGVGVPQVSAIGECVPVARKYKRTIIADGGVKYSGDMIKALALGAGAVMLGNLLAGSEESPGETILYQGRTYKVYRGMGSLGAMQMGSRDRYFQGEVREDGKLVPEGIEGKVPYRGSVRTIVHQLLGGVKSGMGYVGAETIDELQKKARFIRVSSQGLKESHVHDVTITKEAPNYRLE